MAKGKEFKRLHSNKGKRFEVPDSEQPPDYGRSKPSFSLKHMVYQGNCCISKCLREEKAQILESLQRLSQASWNEIFGWGKKQGFEPIPRYRFNVPLPDIFTPEETVLVARYNEAGRMAGFRDNDVFHVVLVGTDLYSH